MIKMALGDIAPPFRIKPHLVFNPQQQTKAQAGHNQAIAAVTDEGQGQPFGGQYAHIDPDIDKRLQTDKETDAKGYIGREQASGMFGLAADAEGPPYQETE